MENLQPLLPHVNVLQGQKERLSYPGKALEPGSGETFTSLRDCSGDSG